jgi:uncharacterized protein YqgC (DUF456 family)
MGRFFALMTLIVIGIIVADAIIHPAGTKALGGTANAAWGTTTKALLGKA